METFAAVAAAHFLALLIPGADFFLIVRSAITSGWRVASGACVGIALAHALLITAAFSGLSFVTNPVVLAVIQAAGGAFLIYVGIAFLRATIDLSERGQDAGASWLRNAGLGASTALLNPKNPLFYVSLASAVAGSGPGTHLLYGAWMVGVVLAWDLFVAVVLGSERALRHLGRVMPWVTKISGGFLVLFGATMIVTLAVQAVW